MNGLSATLGITQPWNAQGDAGISAASTGTTDALCLVEAQVSYSWTGDFAGKVWGGFIHPKM